MNTYTFESGLYKYKIINRLPSVRSEVPHLEDGLLSILSHEEYVHVARILHCGKDAWVLFYCQSRNVFDLTHSANLDSYIPCLESTGIRLSHMDFIKSNPQPVWGSNMVHISDFFPDYIC